MGVTVHRTYLLRNLYVGQEATVRTGHGRTVVAIVHSVVSNSLQPHGLQHRRLPCCLQISWSLLKLMPIESAMPSNHLILCRPLLLLPSIFSSSRVFSIESALHIRWPKYWSFCFSINPSNEYSGLISFRIDWFDFPAVQWTLKSLLQYHSTKASILRCSAIFLVQLSHMYMTTGKTIALTIWTSLSSKVMSLLFIMLSRFITAFLSRSKHLLISCLQSLSAVILEPKKIKSITVSIVSPSICYVVMGLDAVIFECHGRTDWFKPGKEVRQCYILSFCLFNLFAEYIMQNARLDESQAGIKITWRSINNLTYADDAIRN